MTRRLRMLCRCIPLFLLLVNVAAAPGSLDPSFGGTGKIRVGVGGSDDYAHAIARQADGKLVVAGWTDGDDEGESTGIALGISILRYNPNGTLDLTFGTNGKVVTRISGRLNYVQAVAILPDQTILVAGYSQGFVESKDFVLAKYDSTGALDVAFGVGGIVLTDFGGASDSAYAMAVQPDGKILLAGESSSHPALARYNPDGTLDPSFDGDGKVTATATATADGYAVTVLNGRIYLAGSSSLSCYNSDGSVNNHFGSGGTRALSNPGCTGGSINAYALAVLAVNNEEKIIVAGRTLCPGGTTMPTVWSYDAHTGAPDQSFGSGGAASLPFPGSVAHAVSIQTLFGVPNRIVVAGTRFGIGTVDFFVGRTFLDGTLDPSFDGDGFATVAFKANDFCTAMLIDPSGSDIVVAGFTRNITSLGTSTWFSDGDVALARFNTMGALDLAFSGDGKQVDNVGDIETAAVATLVQPDGKIITLGDHCIARFNTDGSFDPTFDEDGKAKVSAGNITSAALQPDGKIVLVASFSTLSGPTPLNYFLVYRLNANGSPDTSFDGDGFAGVTAGTTQTEAHAVAVQTDGKIVVAGSTKTSATQNGYAVAVARFLPSGMLDLAFGADGKVVTSVGTGSPIAHTIFASGISSDYGAAIVMQSDGKIVVASSAHDGTQSNFAVMRYDSNGALDDSFGGVGTLMTGRGVAKAVAMRGDKIVLAGYAIGAGASEDFVLVRLSANGSFDTSLGGSGRVTVPIGTGSLDTDRAAALGIQSDGRIVLAGMTRKTFLSDFALVRFNEDGSIDGSYGDAGKVILDLGYSDEGYALALDSLGRAVIVGGSGDIAGNTSTRFAIARLLADEQLVGAVSRKIHLGNSFDIDLPLQGSPAVECRGASENGEHQIVLTFANPVTFASASVVSGEGSVRNVIAKGAQATINLTGVTNAQQITLALSGVNTGAQTADVSIPIGFLLGDVNGNGVVNTSDVGQTKSLSGQATTATNFRADVNASGSITASDVGQVKSLAGTMLPP